MIPSRTQHRWVPIAAMGAVGVCLSLLMPRTTSATCGDYLLGRHEMPRNSPDSADEMPAGQEIPRQQFRTPSNDSPKLLCLGPRCQRNSTPTPQQPAANPFSVETGSWALSACKKPTSPPPSFFSSMSVPLLLPQSEPWQPDRPPTCLSVSLRQS